MWQYVVRTVQLYTLLIITMEKDNLFLHIGESGAQQIKYGAILGLLKVYTPFHILQYTFVDRPSTFHCSSGDTSLTNKCFHNKRSGCDNLTFTESTISSEWGLVCDDNWLSKTTMSTLMIGFLLGALILGNLADRIGRKTNLVITLVGMMFFNLISGLTSFYSVYLMSRLMVGFCVAGNVLSIVVLISELVGPSYRATYGLVTMGCFPIGVLLLSLLSYHIRSWRLLTTMVTVLGMPLLLITRLLVESPRWLLSQNRVEDAECVVATIAAGNGYHGKVDMKSMTGNMTNTSTESVLAMISTPGLGRVTSILCYSWVVAGAGYYGLTLAAGSAGGGGDIYTKTAGSGLVELPALFLTYYCMENIGRRKALAWLMVASGFCCLAIPLFYSLGSTYLNTE